MSAGMTQGVLAILFLVIAVCTFLLQGKQWPTFISACLFGMCFAATDWGTGLMGWIRALAMNIFQAAS
jgi:hypothetical protein